MAKKVTKSSDVLKAIFSIIGNPPAREIAQKTGITPTTAWRILTGNMTKVNLDQVDLLMKGYDITWERILWILTDPRRKV